MRTTHQSRDANMYKVEVDIDHEKVEIKKLEDSNSKLKIEIDKNE